MRLFEPVVAVKDGYHLTECGLEYADGGVDSVVVGAATHTLTSWFAPKDASEAEVEVDAEPTEVEAELVES